MREQDLRAMADTFSRTIVVPMSIRMFNLRINSEPLFQQPKISQRPNRCNWRRAHGARCSFLPLATVAMLMLHSFLSSPLLAVSATVAAVVSTTVHKEPAVLARAHQMLPVVAPDAFQIAAQIPLLPLLFQMLSIPLIHGASASARPLLLLAPPRPCRPHPPQRRAAAAPQQRRVRRGAASQELTQIPQPPFSPFHELPELREVVKGPAGHCATIGGLPSPQRRHSPCNQPSSPLCPQEKRRNCCEACAISITHSFT